MVQAPHVLGHLAGAQLKAHLLSTKFFSTQLLQDFCHDGSSAQVSIAGTCTVDAGIGPVVGASVGASVGVDVGSGIGAAAGAGTGSGMRSNSLCSIGGLVIFLSQVLPFTQ